MKAQGLASALRLGTCAAAALLASTRAGALEAPAPAPALPMIERFENFGEADGIPAHKVHAVLKTSDNQLWIGTWDGLCVREENGKFKRYGPEQGLSHRLVLSMVEDTKTGDLWV